MQFKDRTDAGQWLGGELTIYANCPKLLVLAVSPGGVPVASAVAHTLNAPLEILAIRGMLVPGEQAISLGAIAQAGMRYINRELVEVLEIPEAVVERFIAQAQQELARWERTFYADHRLPSLRDGTIILVDEGMTTGATMQAAVTLVRQQQPTRVIVAVPVASASACKTLGTKADALACLYMPQRFYNVGMYYRNFPDVTEDNVCVLLKQAAVIPAI